MNDKPNLLGEQIMYLLYENCILVIVYVVYITVTSIYDVPIDLDIIGSFFYYNYLVHVRNVEEISYKAFYSSSLTTLNFPG